MSPACLGCILLARSLQATRTVLETTAGMFLRIREAFVFLLLFVFFSHLLQRTIERSLTGQ